MHPHACKGRSAEAVGLLVCNLLLRTFSATGLVCQRVRSTFCPCLKLSIARKYASKRFSLHVSKEERGLCGRVRCPPIVGVGFGHAL